MKSYWISLLLLPVILGCQPKVEQSKKKPLEGTWELIAVINKENGETFNTYVEGRRMIKIITPTHFSFVNHDLNQGKDSTAFFAAGAGRYKLEGDNYQEQLEFCTARGWEGHVFDFKVQIKGDTLIQQGVEKSEELGVDRYILETYVRQP
ncbi:hypothetical protein [Reichenbachiella sp.]|uniref:hypothetical protein n=1 Tax=Reichenbachiella sp. TaxID=2184521 RepID=UPI003BAE318A